MTTEVQEGANGKLKQTEVEPLGEIKEELKKPVDLCNAGDANGKIEKGGCESLAEKDEPLTKNGASKQKRVVNSGEDEEDANEPQDVNEYSSEEEEGDVEGDVEAREGEGEPYEEEDEEYVDDGEEDEGDEDESEPPSKRRK